MFETKSCICNSNPDVKVNHWTPALSGINTGLVKATRGAAYKQGRDSGQALGLTFLSVGPDPHTPGLTGVPAGCILGPQVVFAGQPE